MISSKQLVSFSQESVRYRMVRTVDSVLSGILSPPIGRLVAPAYVRFSSEPSTRSRIGLAVSSMKDHTSDEGWQQFVGLEHAGYQLCGHGLPINQTNVPRILAMTNPCTVVMQDKREWDSLTRRDFRDPLARFSEVSELSKRSDIFKLTILKDAHQRPQYHADSASEIGCHAWIVYYHPHIVAHLAPYVRSEHLIRTYHSVDASIVPYYSTFGRDGALLSGAISSAYPLRHRLLQSYNQLPKLTYLPHPGYHRRGCATPSFLRELTKYKVAICTSSIYGYSLRKIIEATAAGCVVVTDLPKDDVLPEIQDNLVWIHPDWSINRIRSIFKEIYAGYNPERQEHFSRITNEWYDYRAVGTRLAADIEKMKAIYKSQA